jgi:hypothetical protein
MKAQELEVAGIKIRLPKSRKYAKTVNMGKGRIKHGVSGNCKSNECRHCFNLNCTHECHRRAA